MLPTPLNYSIWPAVVPADKTVQMTVTANERAFFFPENGEYRLVVIAENCDENYYAPQTHRTFHVTAHDGVLSFACCFEGEQAHTIRLMQEDKVLQVFRVYSLLEDLYSLRPLKGDLHSHSCRSDGKRDPVAEAGHYREQGYDFVALTDHNRYYPGGEILEAYAGVETGLTLVRGEEVHSPGSVVHIVHVGGTESVVEHYVHDREAYDATIEAYMEKVPAHVPEDFRSRYAKAMWATDTIHACGGLAIFPHPFWLPGASGVHNVRTDYARLLLTSGMFDAYELIGGMGQVGNNMSVAMWADLRAQGLNISVVGSSDVHGMENSKTFPHLFTLCFAKENTNDGVVEAIKNGYSVAVEASGKTDDRQYRCYGSFRLVSYAQFLLSTYFQNVHRLAAGTGVAMRAYAMHETDASLVQMHAELIRNYADRFFGRKAPILPDAQLMEFEDRWRERQLNGPKTRGSSVDATPAANLI